MFKMIALCGLWIVEFYLALNKTRSLNNLLSDIN